MPPELHLHPDRLLAHATAASGLSEELRAALLGSPVVGGPLPDEQERLLGVVGAAVRELAELGTALGGVAAAAAEAEAAAGAAFVRVRGSFGREPA